MPGELSWMLFLLDSDLFKSLERFRLLSRLGKLVELGYDLDC